MKNTKLDECSTEGRRESDPAKRRAIYLVDREARPGGGVTVPLFDQSAVWAFRTGVQGVKYNFNAYPVLSDTTIRR